MAIEALGKVTVPTPGEPVKVTINLDPTEYTRCHGILVQALTRNTGKVYVGLTGMNAAALTGVVAMLGVPTPNFIPSFNAANTFTPNGLMASEFWIDTDNADDGAIVSIIVT